MTLVWLIAGLVLLIAGAEALVRGSSRLAAAAGISPLVIGLTVVAFGTSSPELAVSVKAALAGQTDITVGNVVGSNIFNVLFILGLAALVTPLIVSQQLLRLDVPLMIAASLVFMALGADGTLGRLDGLLLFGGLVAYTVFLIFQSRREAKPVQDTYEAAYGVEKARSPLAWLANLGWTIGGLVLLVIGAAWLVDAAVVIARRLGLSELIVGLTIVAAGTSLPEVAASIVAGIRGERDIAVGNVIGSCLFNLMGVAGLAGLTAPEGLSVSAAALRFDIPVMAAAAVACLPIFFTGYCIGRWEGALFLAYYIAYSLYLILDAAGHDGLGAFAAAMTWFVMPLTAVTLAVVTLRAWRHRRRHAPGD